MTIAHWAFAVSVLSLLTSAAAVTWSVMSFRRSGAQLSMRVSGRYETLSSDTPQVYTCDHGKTFTFSPYGFKIDIYNSGRMGMDIVKILLDAHAYESVDLPVRIEAGGHANFVVALPYGIGVIEKSDKTRPVHKDQSKQVKLKVCLGDGTIIERAQTLRTRFRPGAR